MLSFVFAILVVLLDQFIKEWVTRTIELGKSADLIPGIIGITHVENPGAAFSILANQRWLLIGIACIATLLLIAILLRYDDGFWGTLGLSAVLGGTVGNLIDRIFNNGRVVDIFNFEFVNFAIFNVADIFITLGGIVFLIHFIVSTIKPARVEENVYDEVTADYSDEQYQEEDQIGLYDFQYDEQSQNRDDSEYEHTFDAGNYSNPYIEPMPEQEDGSYDGYYEQEAYEDTDVTNKDATADAMYAINALDELELELEETSLLEEYDLDALLREYGFEDDDNQV